MLNSTQAYVFGYDNGHLDAEEAQDVLNTVGVLNEAAYDAFWNGWNCFQDECEDAEYEDEYDYEYERDLMLEQQEREDFCECDESYGYYGEDW